MNAADYIAASGFYILLLCYTCISLFSFFVLLCFIVLVTCKRRGPALAIQSMHHTYFKAFDTVVVCGSIKFLNKYV